jgi:hypothetical protein
MWNVARSRASFGAITPVSLSSAVVRSLAYICCNSTVIVISKIVFAFLRLLLPMSERTSAKHPSKAHERPAVADGAFVTPDVADYLTVKAEDGIPQGKATFSKRFFVTGHM